MKIKATLFVLVILLVAVIAISYYVTKEGFEDVAKPVPGVKYNIYANVLKNRGSRSKETVRRYLTTLAGSGSGNLVGTWTASTKDSQQNWMLNEKGNLVTDHKSAFPNHCIQVNGGAVSIAPCTATSTTFNYVNNRLQVIGTQPQLCLNVAGGNISDGAIVDAFSCTGAQPDTITWFFEVSPNEKAAADAREAEKLAKEKAAELAALPNELKVGKKYNLFVKTSTGERCLSPLAMGQIGVTPCQYATSWYINENGNLLCNHPDYQGCVFTAKNQTADPEDNVLFAGTNCTDNSAKFKYANNTLFIVGSSNKCVMAYEMAGTGITIVGIYPCDTLTNKLFGGFQTIQIKEITTESVTPTPTPTPVAPASTPAPQPTPTTPAPQATPTPAPTIPESTPAPASTTPATTTPASTTTASTTATTTPTSTTPQNIPIVPQTTISDTGMDASSLQKQMDLFATIQKIVRNELLASRSTEPILPGQTKKEDSKKKDTESTAQGKEYEDSCYKGTEYRCPKNADGSCPPVPDMSKYIQKDQIPCWGCSLDY